MADYIQFSAKTKNEAITRACIELETTSDQLEIQVISEGSSGFFGMGRKPAIIKVRKIVVIPEEPEVESFVETVKFNSIKEDTKHEMPKAKIEVEASVPQEEPVKEKIVKEEKVKEEKVKETSSKERQPKERNYKEKSFREKQPKEKIVKEKVEKPSKPVEILSNPAEIREIEERACVFLKEVFASMDLGDVEIISEYNTTDGCLEVAFEGENMGILIGKRGQTLDSLQYLTSLVVNKGKTNYIRVKLDTEDYRKRRKETLENLARGIAYKVKKTRRPVILEPMNPYERRIIHSALQGNKFVETVSEGEEPYRHVVVKLKRHS